MESLYLYLARRDKKGVRLLATLNGKQSAATRLGDIRTLQLPAAMERELADVIYENRMYWEPWIESAASFKDLKSKLSGRGYKELPIHNRAAVTDHGQPTANTTALPKNNVMVQRSRKSS